MQKLRATKEFRYSTRRLLPGDVFEASSRDARLLLAVRKAEVVREPAIVPPPPPEVAAKIAAVVLPPDLNVLRAEYEAVIGRKPFTGWGAEVLRNKIADAKKVADA